MTHTDRYIPYPDLVLPALPKLDSSTLRVNGGSVTVLSTRATGPRAHLFIHGMNGTSTTWAPILRVLADARYLRDDIVVLDMGMTRLPRSVGDLERFSDAITAHLYAGGWRDVALVAHSVGGSLAAFMASRPALVRFTALHVVSGLFLDLFQAARTSLLALDRSDHVQSTMIKLRMLSALGPVAGPLIKAAALSPITRKLASKSMFAEADGVPTDVITAQLNAFHRQTLSDTLAIGRLYPAERVYANLAIPVRQVIGDCDPLIRRQDAEAAARLIPDYSWTEITRAAHFPHIEWPHATAAALFPDLRH